MIRISHLSDPEIRRFRDLLHKKVIKIAAKDNSGFYLSLRDEFLFLVALFTGLKTSELIKLKKHHVDLSLKILHVVDSPNPRDIPLSFDFSREFSGYMARMDLSPQDYLFPSNKGQKMTQRAVQFRFLIYMKELGLKYSVFALRHTFAIKMIAASQNPLWVTELLGLKTRSQISVYLHHIKTPPRQQWQIIHDVCS